MLVFWSVILGGNVRVSRSLENECKVLCSGFGVTHNKTKKDTPPKSNLKLTYNRFKVIFSVVPLFVFTKDCYMGKASSTYKWAFLYNHIQWDLFITSTDVKGHCCSEHGISKLHLQTYILIR